MTTAASFAEFVAEVGALADESYPDAELMFRELEVERRRLEAKQAALLAMVEDRKQFRADGHASVFGMLRSALHWSEAECRSRTKLARLAADYPDVAEALWDGQISVANAGSIARLYANPRVHDRFESVLGNLLREAAVCEHDDFRRIPERWELITDRRSRRERRRAHDQRSARFSFGDGRGKLVVEWGDLEAAQNAEIFEQYVDAEFKADWDLTKQRFGDLASMALMPRTEMQRRADAVSAMFASAYASKAGGKKPEPVALVMIDYHTAHELMVDAGLFREQYQVDPFDDPTPLISRLHCETIDGVVINPDTVLQVLLEGHVRFVIQGEDGVPISWGRERRFFEGAARDAVLCLMGRCSHPGCRVRARQLEIDHSKSYSEGGLTEPGNGNGRCSRHNLKKFRERWRVDRDSDGHFHTYRADGTEIR